MTPVLLDLLAHVLTPVQAQARTLPDTMIVRVAPGATTGLQSALMVAAILAVLLAYAALALAVIAAVRVRKDLEETRASLEAVSRDVRSITEQGARLAESVTGVAESLRA